MNCHRDCLNKKVSLLTSVSFPPTGQTAGILTLSSFPHHPPTFLSQVRGCSLQAPGGIVLRFSTLLSPGPSQLLPSPQIFEWEWSSSNLPSIYSLELSLLIPAGHRFEWASQSRGGLLEPQAACPSSEFLTQDMLDIAQELAFLTGSQKTLMLLISAPESDNPANMSLAFGRNSF